MILKFRATSRRGRLTVPVACAAIAGMLPFSAATAGYEIPNPAGGAALYQDAAQDPSTGEWIEPATADPTLADHPAPGQGSTPAATEEWVEPAPVDPATVGGEVDPVTDEWIDPAPVKESEPAPVAAPVAPAPSAAPAPLNTPDSGGTEPWGQPIATAYIAGTGGDGAPCLTSPQWGAETLALLNEGEPVEVRAETMGEWQPVNCAAAGGYVHAALIAWAPAGPADPAATGGDQPAGKTGSGGAVGEQIAIFARQYEGYPYVYAGEGPYAFDCSGFTMFVIRNTLGIDIPHDMFVQYQMGRSVSREELQPGDLVFFANTIRPGMSHNGVYIGGGQFVHAENEGNGVRISDIDSEYYSSRWYGAVRFA